MSISFRNFAKKIEKMLKFDICKNKFHLRCLKGANFRGFVGSGQIHEIKYPRNILHCENSYPRKNLEKPQFCDFFTLGRHRKKIDLNKARTDFQNI